MDQTNGNVKIMPIFYGMLAFTRFFDNGDSVIFKVQSSVASRYIKLWGVETSDRNIRVCASRLALKYG